MDLGKKGKVGGGQRAEVGKRLLKSLSAVVLQLSCKRHRFVHRPHPKRVMEHLA